MMRLSVAVLFLPLVFNLTLASFGPWSDWGACSSSCGNGLQVRERKCDGEGPCEGQTVEGRSCYAGQCGGVEFGPWGPWSTCSASCGPGIEQRTRVCPTGVGCVGTPNEIRSCDKGNCGELNYGPWSEWGACTATCGYGMQDRTRVCQSVFGCAGPASETRQCTLLDCPSAPDVSWNEWTSFSSCSATCGSGVQSRSRTCPVEGACVGGVANEEVPCDTGDCPVNWNPWSSFSPCSVSCGFGTRSRSRTCPLDGACGVGVAVEEIPCDSGTCPEWNEWTSYSSCSVTCGSGVQSRSRTCPVEGACIGGVANEEVPCDTGACPVFWGEWSPFGACSASCGGGVQTRTRTCPIEGSCGTGEAVEEQSCNTGECPILWGSWSRFSPCTVTCGAGVQFRQRQCPIDGACLGTGVEQMQCYTGECPDLYSQWTPWSDCSRSCGLGVQERSRDCSGRCFEPTKETRECVLAICPGPEWSPWSPFTECSATCANGGGQGIQERTRSCPTNDPSQVCVGAGKETRDCFIACDTASWANWQEWGQCSADCGPGIQTRKRFCARAFPTLTCPGDDTETRPCSGAPCQAPEWSPWSPFTECSATCANGGGQGIQERTRSCPTNDINQVCVGAGKETRDCFIACDTASWANWQEWGQCSASCGSGIQTRKRFCARAFPTLTCPGDDTETRSCSGAPCPSRYSNWGGWGQCSVSCGDGIQIRNRLCLDVSCTGPTSESRSCSIICEAPKPVAPVNPKLNGQTNNIPNGQVKPSPIVGKPPVIVQWSPWTFTGACSVTCGTGRRPRSRTCPVSGACAGASVDTIACVQKSCDSGSITDEGKEPTSFYLSWTSWSDCSAPCGDGQQIRVRICVGLLPCPGSDREYRPCLLKPCAPGPDGGNVIPGTVSQCYDCNSGWAVCDPKGVTNPDWVGRTACPITGTCFMRQDRNGYVYRGCADAWHYLMDHEVADGDMVCSTGASMGYGSFVNRWCLCKGDLCNGGEMPPV